jgi:ATP adenylyltransferase
MDLIRAPWRREYVTGTVNDAGCLFCRSLDDAKSERSLVVHVARQNFVVVNLYPYNSGHIMIAPLRHVGSLGEADDDELWEMMSLARASERILIKIYNPDGVNVGMNLGRSAGAGVIDHIHMHMVPRWTGDVNFMTVVGETRIIPEDPMDAARRLRAAFEDELAL